MRKALLITGSLLAASPAFAGGLERSGQPVTLLFEKGNLVTLDLYYLTPSAVGIDAAGTSSGNVGNNTYRFGGGIKNDFNEKWSAALIIDQPYGADFAYSPTSRLFGGTGANVDSVELTGLVRYKFNQFFSVHGGPRLASFSADASLGGAAYGRLSGYKLDMDNAWSLGYVVGGAVEIPQIAGRLAVTYGSPISFQLDTHENILASSTANVTMPQSVNVDFQVGVAKDTLLYGTARWANYDGWSIAPGGLLAVAGVPLASKDYDIWNFKAGLGRKLNETWSVAVQTTYEPAINKPLGPLNPYDGYVSLGGGVTYTTASGSRITVGAEYAWLGDVKVVSGGGSAAFNGNSAAAVAVKLAVPY
ncbi:hypothetical protein [Bradyrhizobium sp. USDA 3315]